MEHLAGDRLRDTWDVLDETQRLAVAESLYDPDRRFRPDRFRAKYSKLPRGLNEVGHRQSSPLRLFLHPTARYVDMPEIVPADLAKRLRVFVPEPPRVEVRTTPELPDEVRQPHRGYVRQGDARPFDLVELQRHDSEQVALREAMRLLRLVQSKAVTVSTATRRATTASVKRIGNVLEDGTSSTRMSERRTAGIRYPDRCERWHGLCCCKPASSRRQAARNFR